MKLPHIVYELQNKVIPGRLQAITRMTEIHMLFINNQSIL